MIVCDNETDREIPLALLQEIKAYLSEGDVELVITDDIQIKEINFQYRGIDKATDVLSFPLEAIEGFPLGSIMISVDQAAAAAAVFGHSFEDEIALLFTHGLLHLLGYDHEVDTGEMREMERNVMVHFKLPESLILRND